MNRVGWPVAGLAAVVLGVTGCGGGGGATQEKDTASRPTASSATARPEDSGAITKTEMRMELDSVTADVGAPPNDPDWARLDAKFQIGNLGDCTVSYKGFDTAAATLDVSRSNALADALTGRGWVEARKRKERTAADGTVDLVEGVFKKRGWTVVMEYRLFTDKRSLGLTAFDEACVRKVRAAGGASSPS
ncbi:hypothetical protein ACFU5Y_33600 [Streptomyces gardneri]|uniref:hypothetical protein n=1 Tax=Streptomyces gardneri TaxID=66892 RepID=UPI0036BA986E